MSDGEMFEQFTAVGGVMHFRVELHAEIFAFHVTHRREGTVSAFGERNKSFGQLGHFVAVRHPDFGESIVSKKYLKGDLAPNQKFDFCMTIFAFCRWIHLAAEGVGEGLHPIANAEDGKSAFEDEFLNEGRVLFIDRFGSAGQNKSLRFDRKDFFLRGIPRKQLAVDLYSRTRRAMICAY
jgi:hypothetical protein